LATTLVQALIKEAEARGATRIWLRATDQGRPIYARAGFVPGPRYMERRLGSI